MSPALLLLATALSAAAEPPPRPLLAAEDARARGEALLPLLAALSAPEPGLRALAARGLGRLERPEQVPRLAPLLEHAEPEVRRAAALALLQSSWRGSAGPARAALLARLDRESDPAVRGELLLALGWLPGETRSAARSVEEALLAEAGRPGAELVAVSRGLEALLRRGSELGLPTPLGRRTLVALSQQQPRSGLDPDQAAQVRRRAVAALAAVGEPAALAAAATDPDPQVRRLAVLGLAAGDAKTARRRLDDDSPLVRHAALKALAESGQLSCDQVLARFDDPGPHVAHAALEIAAGACPGDRRAAARLAALAVVPEPGAAWQRGARALLGLSGVDPAAALERLAAFAASGEPWLRRYAVRAAARLAATDRLAALAADADPNVAREALQSLTQLAPHAHDALYRAALERDDPELLLVASRALAGSPDPERATPALVAALARQSESRCETSRDVRLELIERLAELGGDAAAGALRSRLTDFDPAVADAAAQALRGRGERAQPDPRPLPRAELPDLDQLRALGAARAVLVLAGGGRVRLRLLASEAPLNAARFARLARAGYYDGLSFHRVEPGFVVQGGSPSGNEYAGDGPFTRDEITGRSHLRGSVGVSTRGRDTGDGQLFVNLVDNPRLDFQYTLFAEVESGMDVFDAALEGTRIVGIEWR